MVARRAMPQPMVKRYSIMRSFIGATNVMVASVILSASQNPIGVNEEAGQGIGGLSSETAGFALVLNLCITDNK